MTSLSGYVKDMGMNHLAVKKSRDNFDFFYDDGEISTSVKCDVSSVGRVSYSPLNHFIQMQITNGNDSNFEEPVQEC